MLVCALMLVHRHHVGHYFDLFSTQLFGVVALTCLTLYLFDVYRIDYDFPSFSFPARGFAAVVVSGLVLAAIIYVLPEQTKASSRDTIYWRGVLVVSMLLFAGWVVVSRFVASAIFKNVVLAQQWLVLGAPETTGCLVADFERIRIGERLQRVSPDDFPLVYADGESDEASGPQADSFSRTGKWAGIVVARTDDLTPDMINGLMRARLAGVRIYDVFDFYETFLLKVPVDFMHDQWLAMSQGFSLVHHNVQLKVKKFADIALASLILAAASPIMLFVAIAVKLDSEGPAIYSQDRVGLNGRVFRIFKFRTMVNDAEVQGERWADAEDPRVTRIGRFLRPSRLDELPQLWNVLKGDMSFVGPRPERPTFTRNLEEQIPYYNMRVLIKPGITGWAQVQYPYGASIEDARQKLEYDLYYIKNYSILLDLAILFKTVRVVLFRSGR